MGVLIYGACIVILTILFRFLSKSMSPVKFILISAFSLTIPFLIALLINQPPKRDASFFFSLPIIFSILNGLYGFVYYRLFRAKSKKE